MRLQGVTPFLSPTTPGLYITFRAYIIELVCLNVNKKIGLRFWSDPKYWGPKFRRETKGVYNVARQLNINDPLIQTALVQIIKEHNIKALVAKRTVEKVVRLTLRKIEFLKKQREILAQKQQPIEIDEHKNATFIDTGKESTIAKVRKAESGQEI